MIYFLLLFFPIALAGMCFVLRKQTHLAGLMALLAVILEAVLVVLTPIERPAQLLGVHLTVVPLNRIFLVAFCLALMVAFLATFQIPHGENFPAIALLTLGLVAAAMVMQEPLVITLLLLASGLAVILALVDMPAGGPGLVQATSIEAALRYLALMLLAGLVLALGYVLVDTTRLRGADDLISAKLILALLLIGFALRLAAVPFHSWLPDLVDHAAPLVSLLVVGIINVTVLLFLVLSFQYIPETLIDNPDGPHHVRLFGIVTAVSAAVLLVRQRSLRRFVAFLMIYNTGVILSGVVSSSTGLTGALFETFNQLLFAVLLFLSLGLLERRELRAALPGEGLLRRKPLASATFIGGALGLLGLPPFSGFASKSLIYEGVAHSGWGYLAALLAAAMISLYALVLLLREHFLGRPAVEQEEADFTQPEPFGPLPELQREPRLLAGVALTLLLGCVALGLYPQPLLDHIVEAVESLTYAQML